MSGQSEDGADRKQCTDKTCMGEAVYALWMGEQFSRVADAHPSYSYDDGDLHPHVCEDCLPRYRDLHGDKGEFVRPEEKLVADGGDTPAEDEQSFEEWLTEQLEHYRSIYKNGQRTDENARQKDVALGRLRAYRDARTEYLNRSLQPDTNRSGENQ